VRDGQEAADGDYPDDKQDDDPELARAQRRIHVAPIGRPGDAGLPETGDTRKGDTRKREGAVSRALGGSTNSATF
jgi:hypothetical protein